MSLVVEDGTAKVDAESYITVAAADTHHAALGNTAWAAIATTALKEGYLRQATRYMLQAYRQRWAGVRATTTQALDWPRSCVVVDRYTYLASTTLPADVANACADLALKALAGELNADLTRAVVRRKVGPLETEYDPYSPQSPRYRAIDMALAPYLSGSSAMATLVRA